jgi:hypothetical protein
LFLNARVKAIEEKKAIRREWGRLYMLVQCTLMATEYNGMIDWIARPQQRGKGAKGLFTAFGNARRRRGWSKGTTMGRSVRVKVMHGLAYKRKELILALIVIKGLPNAQ